MMIHEIKNVVVYQSIEAYRMQIIKWVLPSVADMSCYGRKDI